MVKKDMDFEQVLASVSCQICASPTSMVRIELCDSCYEIETRLPRFLSYSAGRSLVRKLLAERSKESVQDEKDAQDLCERGIQICSPKGCNFFGSKKKEEVPS